MEVVEVLSSPTWRAKENKWCYCPWNILLKPNCNFKENGGKSCTQIDNYQEVMETHPYNSANKVDACKFIYAM